MTVRIINADVMDGLRQLPDESVHCCVTSPPYWQLRDYQFEGQIGLEPNIEAHVAKMVEVFAEVRRVLRKDGVLFLNYGDMYANDGKWGGSTGGKHAAGNHGKTGIGRQKKHTGLKPKDLVMMPERVALALQADGWWVRDRIIWHKPNPMPSSTDDRCTPSYEIVWHLTKASRYYWDAVAISEPAASARTRAGFNDRWDAAPSPMTRNRRNVWTIATEPYREAHFATMPTELARLCIAAGSSEHGCCSACGAPWQRITETSYVNPGNRTTNGSRSIERRHETAGFAQRLEKCVGTIGWQPSCECFIDDKGAIPPDAVPCTVLDPFGGAGTTGLVADRLQRNAILIEGSAKYVEEHIRPRISRADGPLLGLLAEVPE